MQMPKASQLLISHISYQQKLFSFNLINKISKFSTRLTQLQRYLGEQGNIYCLISKWGKIVHERIEALELPFLCPGIEYIGLNTVDCYSLLFM